MSESAGPSPREPLFSGRGLHVFVAVVTVIALVGLIVGTGPWVDRSPVAGALPATDETAPDQPVMAARAYGDIAARPLRQSHPGATELESRAIGPLGELGPVLPSDEARGRALDERQARRAYEGAPPVIPHPSTQLGPLACMACHDLGVRVGLRTAPPMSHEYRGACTQCHVSADNPLPFSEREPEALALDNAFEGLSHSVAAAPRLSAEAPPMTPHATHMRERCDSCHGAAGREGLSTDHAWRASCTQCHAASAVLDQIPGAAAPPFGDQEGP